MSWQDVLIYKGASPKFCCINITDKAGVAQINKPNSYDTIARYAAIFIRFICR